MDPKYVRIGHFLRWGLELLIIWTMVVGETGFWTAAVLTLITVGIEFDHLRPGDWAKL